MSRPARILMILGIAIAFIAISLGVGRMLAASGAERSQLEQVIRAEAKGDSAGLAALLPACGAGTACRAQVDEVIAKVGAPGQPLEILQIDGGTGSGAGSADGTARIAWHAGTRLPTVQCVKVHRSGDVISGFGIQIVSVSQPIAREGTCEKQKI